MALNERADVTGWHGDPLGPTGYFWSSGTLTDFPRPLGTGYQPMALNNSGTVVGYFDGRLSPPYGFRWQSGLVTTLNPLPGDTNSYAQCINDDGIIVGGSFNASASGFPGFPFGRATLWRPLFFSEWPMDLNILSNSPAIELLAANCITKYGTICGRGWANNAIHAWVTTLPPLPPLPNWPRGLPVSTIGSIAAGGRGILITPNGHVIPWPGPDPIDPIIRRLSSAVGRALDSIPDLKTRQQIEVQLLAAIDDIIREYRKGIK